MNKWIIVASVWIPAMALAGALAYKMNHALGTVSSANPPQAQSELRGRVDDESTADTAEPAVLEMPTVTIVGSLRGVAEMQGAGLVVIDPGVATDGK
jgi:hypothetical protein